MVRKDMLNDVIGYRQASVGDMWTGNSNWSKETQTYMRNMMMGIFGNKAYQYFTNAERILQNFIGDAKNMIVVKSVVVPISNMLGNTLQLVAAGIPMKNIAAGLPRKLTETNFYATNRLKQIELEAQASNCRKDLAAARAIDTKWRPSKIASSGCQSTL